MFPLIGLIFVGLLIGVLILLYVNDSSANKKSLAKAKVKEYWSGKDRRKYTRFKNSIELTYVVLKRPHIKSNGCTVDISEGGMKLFINEKLSKGTIMDLQITLPESNKTAEIEGRVVWSDDAIQANDSDKRCFYIGLEFTAIKEPYGNFFINYIRSIAGSGPEF